MIAKVDILSDSDDSNGHDFWHSSFGENVKILIFQNQRSRTNFGNFWTFLVQTNNFMDFWMNFKKLVNCSNGHKSTLLWIDNKFLDIFNVKFLSMIFFCLFMLWVYKAKLS